MNSPRASITLCIIAGNVERYMERFLMSFGPLAERVVIVQATGSQKADETLLIAASVCDRLAIGLSTNEYKNGPGHEEWPHVDDFAAARNLAFGMAKTEWVFWADTDDVIDERSIRLIHGALEKRGADFDAFSMLYEVPEDGVCVYKERLVRRAAGEWRYAVHEEFYMPVSPRIGRLSGEARVVHAPTGVRRANDERNVRLLETMGEAMTTGHKFHLCNSLHAVGRHEDAAKLFAELIRSPELGVEERYELFMAAGQMTEDAATAGQFFLQAFGTDPTRREAAGELVIYSLKQGKMEQALRWAQTMLALPMPAADVWNLRRMYYGWLGVMLHATALRANGLMEEGDRLQLEHFTKHGGKISLLHATRGRAKQAYKCKMRWLELAANADAIEHIFAVDDDDESRHALMMQRHVVVPAGGGCVAAWNAAAAASKGQLLIQLSDDWEPPRHWDALLLNKVPDLSLPRVIGVSDGIRRDGLLCMAIVTRARYLEVGYLFHPRFKSMYSDNWFTVQAARDHVIVDGFDLMFEHLHPIAGKGEMDATYAESNAPERYEEGARVLAELMEVRTWRDIEGFFDYQEFYRAVADRLQDGDTFVEVGVWCGRSINFLATELKRLGKTRVKLVAVDDFSGVPEHDGRSVQIKKHGSVEAAFRANTAACGNLDMIEIVKGKSYQVGHGFGVDSIFGVFIDGAHDERSATQDIGVWRGCVVDDGIVSGHDLRAEGVRKALGGLRVPAVGACEGNVWIDSSRLNPMGPVLSVLVPGIPERLEETQGLLRKLEDLSREHGDRVEILCLLDNKKRSVGGKRQALQDMARGEYIAFVDDDDDVTGLYFEGLLREMGKGRPDVITFLQRAEINGVPGIIVFDGTCKTDEAWKPNGDARRRPWHVCAWRRRLVERCRFGDCNYGEDRVWVDQAAPRVKTSTHVAEVLHVYRHDAGRTAAPMPGAGQRSD